MMEDETTVTRVEQLETEAAVLELLETVLDPAFDSYAIHRTQHIAYIKTNMLNVLPTSFQTLDANRPWLCYWMLHALELLGGRLKPAEEARVVDFLLRCQSPTGGFGGGPGQLAHLAPTYAAVNALVILGSERGLRGILTDRLLQWMLSLRRPDGSFTMHVDGEVDIRGCYCAIAIAKVCNILTQPLVHDTARWIASCQTYEGGLSGLPGLEAHGGYTFCGLAALHLLGEVRLLNLPRMMHWAARRQMAIEGGFQGRTNKLVDSCYSFWMGGLFPILAAWDDGGLLAAAQNSAIADTCLFDRDTLQEYLLACCEMPSGGFRDKPGKPRDFYHTCYALSGMSIAQHLYKVTPDTSVAAAIVSSSVFVRGAASNLTEPTDPVHNVPIDKLKAAYSFFRKNI